MLKLYLAVINRCEGNVGETEPDSHKGIERIARGTSSFAVELLNCIVNLFLHF